MLFYSSATQSIQIRKFKCLFTPKAMFILSFSLLRPLNLNVDKDYAKKQSWISRGRRKNDFFNVLTIKFFNI